jgi:glycosyltransferase involved in cell wall biosynthesis
VVATPFGSVPEIVEEGRTGFLRESIEDLAACLRRVAELDRTACREAAETRFSTARMVADHVALYQELVTRTLPDFTVDVGPVTPSPARMPARDGVTGAA